MKKQASPGFFSFGLLGVIVVAALVLRLIDALSPSPVPPTATEPSVAYEEIVKDAEPAEVPTVPVEEEPAAPIASEPTPPQLLPESLNLAVPFTSQAPFGKWDPLHEDACEEAALYMVLQYYAGVTAAKLDPAATDQVLIDMVETQTAAGLGPSVSLAQLADFAASYAGVTTRIIDNPTVDDIKAEVAKGNPVIVPAAGRVLGNPFFSGEGPLYHMLVIRGYTETGFITNEPGTRQGEKYTYSYDVLMKAMGDWNDGNPAAGAKRVMVVLPKK